jgi:hypothetical protein
MARSDAAGSREAAPGLEQEREAARQDWLLEELVSVMNQSADSSLSIVLTVKGVVMSGMLIGVRQYFELLGRSLGEGFRHASQSDTSADDASQVEQTYAKIGRVAQAAFTDESNERGQGRPQIRFLHLKDPRILVGDQVSHLNSPIPLVWRGKLSEVDGFMLGNLTG